MTVVTDHFTISVAEPVHHDALRNTAVGAGRAEGVAEAVQPTIAGTDSSASLPTFRR